MPPILLVTLNARYVHASLGLRYLSANMGALAGRTRILEFVLGTRALEIVERIVAEAPVIVGFGVYIWNVEETTRIVALLKRVRPEVTVVVGGPEVSYETGEQRICALADHVITGWGDVTFPKLCAEIVRGARPQAKVLAGEQPPLDAIALPYRLYDDADIAARFLYVEASRGCPFKCEFCLSSLDKTAWPFDQARFLAALGELHDRGARHFRFVDRTFNLNVKASLAILEFFLARMDERLFVHFEVIPDHLPEPLRAAIVRFPPHSLQFEVGIQTWNPAVQAAISRRQDSDKTEANLRWLREHSNALVHVDLIAGLPGEDLASFAAGFDRLVQLRPHEIQVGILKRLRGTPIVRHTGPHALVFNPDPPYNILATDCIDFPTMQRIARFARYWDLVANAGRCARSLPLLLGDAPFERFMRFADWFYARTGKTHELALERVFDGLHEFLAEALGIDATTALAEDYAATGAKGRLRFMARGLTVAAPAKRTGMHRDANRQARHNVS